MGEDARLATETAVDVLDIRREGRRKGNTADSHIVGLAVERW